jgi:glycosyltransferase involved in cell wall biosynthesis
MKHTNSAHTAPTVSVVIPAHNAEAFLAEAIESILNQSFSDFELIVVNDGSKDQTLAITKSYQARDPRVKIVSYRHNKGESAAANLGFAKAQGKYIARMDADDIAHVDRLKLQVAFLDQHPDYIVVGSQAHIIDEHNKIVGKKLFPLTHKAIYEEYGNVHPMLHPSIMVRKSMIPWKGKLWANEAEPNDDYFTLFNFLKVGKFANLPQKLILYRMHSNNKSMQHIKKKFINSLRIRMYAVRHLGYRPSARAYFKSAAQTVFVLGMPEWVTLGTFFWMRGMKPFDQAFPFIGAWKEKLAASIRNAPSFEYAIPAFIAVVIHSLISRHNT